MSKRLLVYLVVVHVILAVLAGLVISQVDRLELGGLRSDERNQFYYRQMLAFQQRIDEMVPNGSVVFVGDSHIQSLFVEKVVDHAVNLGIGGDTTSGVLRRLPSYTALQSAEAVVLAVGYNDLKSRDHGQIVGTMAEILDLVPSNVRIVCCGLYPIDERVRKEQWNARIVKLNRSYADLCRERPNARFVDLRSELADEKGNLRSDLHVGDGVHLNLAGRRLVVEILREALDAKSSKN